VRAIAARGDDEPAARARGRGPGSRFAAALFPRRRHDGRRLERGIPGEDLLLELLQGGSGLQPELLGQQPASVLVGL
jgi:hypothetical protein